MNFAKCSLDTSYDNYSYKGASNEEMAILGCFFCSDIGHTGRDSFSDWASCSADGDIVSGNCTVLENENGYIYLSDEFPIELPPTKLKMTINQFVQLCDDWQEKVVKRKPKEVIIKHEHGGFFIETSD